MSKIFEKQIIKLNKEIFKKLFFNFDLNSIEIPKTIYSDGCHRDIQTDIYDIYRIVFDEIIEYDMYEESLLRNIFNHHSIYKIENKKFKNFLLKKESENEKEKFIYNKEEYDFSFNEIYEEIINEAENKKLFFELSPEPAFI
jgi:hypothetical protein